MSESEERPGKIRTWWHPLLTSLLRWQLGDHYELQEEVPVGRKPLQIDVLLLRREKSDLPEKARRVLAGLAEHLNELTLIEFKSPSDTLRVGDFQTFLAYALLYRAQNEPLLAPRRLTLVVLAPRLTKPYADEMQALGVAAVRADEGVWRLEGGAMAGHAAWLLETAALAGPDHPLLSVISPQFVREGERTYDELQGEGYTELLVYMSQQIHLFHSLGKEFAMQHLGAETELVEILRKINASLEPKDRLYGMTPEQLLTALTPEDRAKLRELLNQQAERDSTDPKQQHD